MKENTLYGEMKALREKDKYPDNKLESYLADSIYPHTADALALRLSNVTAGFYGLSLKHAGLSCGWDKIDGISNALFQELGRMKAAEAVETGIDLPKDSRALSMVFITAVFTSSPEYRFEFLKYTPQETVMRIFGACRYYRIARKLNIESYLTWPVLAPFFEGIAEGAGIGCSVSMEVRKLGDDGTCDYVAKFVMDK